MLVLTSALATVGAACGATSHSGDSETLDSASAEVAERLDADSQRDGIDGAGKSELSETATCIPDCAEGMCGDNGCGAPCACPEGWSCNADQVCVCNQEIWVDPAGTGGPGEQDGLPENPFATLASALEVACPGATIHILPGELTGGVVIEVPYVTMSGTDQSAVTILGPDDGINLAIGASGVTVQDLTLVGGKTGIAVLGQEDARLKSATLERIRVANLGAEVECPETPSGSCPVQVDGVLLQYVDAATVAECDVEQLQGGADNSTTTGISLSNCSGFSVSDNHVSGIFAASSAEGGGACVGIEATSSQSGVVELNVIEDIASGSGYHHGSGFAAGISVAGSTGITIQGNRIVSMQGGDSEATYQGHTSGIYVAGGASCTVRRNEIEEVTAGITGVDWGPWMLHTAGVVFDMSSGEIVENRVLRIAGSCLNDCPWEQAVGTSVAGILVVDGETAHVASNIVSEIEGGLGWISGGDAFGIVVANDGAVQVENNTLVAIKKGLPECPAEDPVCLEFPPAGVHLAPPFIEKHMVRNNIIDDVEGYGVLVWESTSEGPAPEVAYNNIHDCLTDVSDGLEMTGPMFSWAPGFVAPEDDDYHLLPSSPCIDAGDPTTGCWQEPAPNGCRVNLGAYGNTEDATSAPGAQHCDVCP